MRKLLIAGNWKMFKTFDEAIDLAKNIEKFVRNESVVDVAVFPPATYIHVVSSLLKNRSIFVGAQNIYPEEEGAFTGEISAKMVLTSGGSMTILGHSERRNVFGEPNDFICKKVKKAMATGLIPVLCIGEKLEEREAGETESVLIGQLEGSLDGVKIDSPDEIVLAYEPVWAIGTGVNATPEQAQATQAFIREWFRGRYGPMADKIRILYGGSVKPSNAEKLLSQADIDGALIGGASLSSESFCEIIAIAKRISIEGKCQ